MGTERRLVVAVVLVGAAAGVAACSAALRWPTPRDAAAASTQWPGTTLGDLERGRTLYVRRCSSCHILYLPSAYGADQWPSLVAGMTERARLSPEQQADVTRFVVTSSRSGPR